MSAFGGKADIGHGSPCHPVRAGFAMTTLRRRCSWQSPGWCRHRARLESGGRIGAGDVLQARRMIRQNTSQYGVGL